MCWSTKKWNKLEVITLAAKRSENVGIMFGFRQEKHFSLKFCVRRNVEKRADIITISWRYRYVSWQNLQETSGKRWEKRKLFRMKSLRFLADFIGSIRRESLRYRYDIGRIKWRKKSKRIFLRPFSLWYRCDSRRSIFKMFLRVVVIWTCRLFFSDVFQSLCCWTRSFPIV